jgi:hypothetical protein
MLAVRQTVRAPTFSRALPQLSARRSVAAMAGKVRHIVTVPMLTFAHRVRLQTHCVAAADVLTSRGLHKRHRSICI